MTGLLVNCLSYLELRKHARAGISVVPESTVIPESKMVSRMNELLLVSQLTFLPLSNPFSPTHTH